MGFSIAASAVIFFSGFLLMLMIFQSSIDTSIDNIKDAYSGKQEFDINQKNTEINIVFERYNRFNDTLIIDVENTGETTLDIRYINLLLNGNIITQNDFDCSLDSSGSHNWLPADKIRIEIENPNIQFKPDLDSRLDCRVSNVQLTSPKKIVVRDRIYIIDNYDHVDVFDINGTYLNSIPSSSELIKPIDISVTSEFIYVLDQNGTSGHLDRFFLNLTPDSNNPIIASGMCESPEDVYITDSELDRYIYINDNNSHVDRFDLDGSNPTLMISESKVGSIIDIYVTDKIYILETNVTSQVNRFNLSVNSDPLKVIENIELTDPIEFAISDENFETGKIYIIDNLTGSKHIDVFDIGNSTTNYSYNSTISNLFSVNICSLDVCGEIYIIDFGNIELVKLQVGSYIKIITENGISNTIII